MSLSLYVGKTMGEDEWVAKYGGHKLADMETCEKALKSAMLRWKGMKPSILARYHLDHEDAKYLASCALCKWSTKRVSGTDARLCSFCPLSMVRGAPCDIALSHEEKPPYHLAEGGTIKPLRAWLRLAWQYYCDNKEKFSD